MKQLRKYNPDMKLKVKVQDRNVGVSILNKDSIYNQQRSQTKLQMVDKVCYCGKTAVFTPFFGKNKGIVQMSSNDKLKSVSNQHYLRPDAVYDFSNKTRNSPLRKLNRYKKF